jgi:hypothetical protein
MALEHTEISRRSLLQVAATSCLGMAINGCTDSLDEYNPKPKVKTPYSDAPVPFDALQEHDSLIGREIIVPTTIAGIQNNSVVRLENMFRWQVNGETQLVKSLSSGNSELKPESTVLPDGSTLEQCVIDCTVGENGQNIVVHTSVGEAVVPYKDIQDIIGQLANRQIEDSSSLSMKLGASVDLRPNTEGQRLLNVGNCLQSIRCIFLNQAQLIELPKTVGITFSGETDQ